MTKTLPPSPAARTAVAEPPEQMGFADLLDLSVKLNSRIDALWQRVIYSHAAMVGVLVFFASAEYPFSVPRILVVFFYTMNALVTYVAFRDAYDGLRAVAADLAQVADQTSRVYQWARGQSYELHAIRRAGIMVVLWLIISYLILAPLIEYWRAI